MAPRNKGHFSAILAGFWIYVFKLEQLVRHVYPYYYDEFDDRILCIPGAKFCHSVAHVYSQTSNLASWLSR